MAATHISHQLYKSPDRYIQFEEINVVSFYKSRLIVTGNYKKCFGGRITPIAQNASSFSQKLFQWAQAFACQSTLPPQPTCHCVIAKEKKNEKKTYLFVV